MSTKVLTCPECGNKVDTVHWLGGDGACDFCLDLSVADSMKARIISEKLRNFKFKPKSKVEASQDIKNPIRFQDVNLCFVERVALAMTEGFLKYEQELDPELKNYLNADLRFALGRVGNAIKHLLSYNEVLLSSLRDGNVPPALAGEDHLGHCAANLNILAKYEEIGLLPNTKVELKFKEELTK